MKKKILLSFMLACIGIFAVGVLSVSAGTYGDLTYQYVKDGVEITHCNTSVVGDITIPKEINTFPVTSIGYDAFSGCSSLTSVTIPDGITVIGSDAFEGCSSLTGVYITDIAAWCNIRFYGDDSNPLYYAQNLYLNGELVTNLIIPDGVTRIGKDAFYNCSSITSITLPDSVTEIGVKAFYGTAYYNNESNWKNDVLYVCNHLIETKSNISGECVIKNSTKTIADDAFYNCNSLTSINIPDSVKYIGEYAFSGCSSLTGVYITDIAAWCNIIFDEGFSNPLHYAHNLYLNGELVTNLRIPDGVTSIGGGAFRYCSSLTAITIPDSVTSIGSSAFYGCSSLTSITLPDSVTSIKWGTFFGCSSLTSIILPKRVTSIGDYAFQECSSLTSITLPNSVESIGNYAFEYCSNLASITLPGGINSTIRGTFREFSNLRNITIGDEVSYIGNNDFGGFSYITSIILPDSLTSIGNYAFSDCSNLKSIEIPESVTSIGSGAFYNCSNLDSIEISGDVTSIGDSAFYNCSNLYSIEVPENVTSIGSSAFYGCSSLTSIIIPDGVTSIGSNAFYGTAYYNNESNWKNDILYVCNHLIKAKSNISGECVIKNSTKTIADDAFYKCGNLTSVTLPGSVISIGTNAFYYCSKIESLYVSDVASYLNCEYENEYSNPMYYADKLYINKKRPIKVVIPESVTKIPEYAFYNCDSLESITIPESVTQINYRAFYNCSSLKNITLGQGVSLIEKEVFSQCTNLENLYISDIAAYLNCKYENEYSYPMYYAKNIYVNGASTDNLVIPDGITGIGNYAFYKCSNLTSITIPDSVISIVQDTFNGCSNLTSISLGKNLIEIETNAFSNCNISTVFYRGTESEWEELYIASGNDKLKQANVIFNAEEKTYHFVTGCDYVVPDITGYGIAVSPTVENGDKRILGWYDNEALSGTPVTFPYYGDATTLYAAWTDRTGTSFDDAFLAETNREYTAATTETNPTVYYEFIPKLTGEYRFYSKGNIDTYATLYNSERQSLKYDNNSGEGNNFKITYNLTAGEKYYIAAKRYSGVGTFTFVTETDCFVGTKTVCVTAAGGEKVFVSIPNYIPENAKIILACYDNGTLAEVQSAPNKNETIYFVVSKAFDSAKVMVWETLDNMRPICDAEIVK